MLRVKDLCVSFGSADVVKNASFSVQEGEWLMVVGPNGAGKSTLINAVSQTLDYTGTVELFGKDVAKCKPTYVAKQMGVLSQNHYVGYSFTVEEVVKLGRYAYGKGIFGTLSDEDDGMVDKALDMTGLEALRHKSVLALSGGELQRVFLAQILAQNPKLLILDEPTNHLDLIYQKQIFNLVQDWLKIPGHAVISVVHDLSLAKAYGTHALLMHKGEIMARGEAKDVFTRQKLHDAYSMDVYDWMNTMLGQWKE